MNLLSVDKSHQKYKLPSTLLVLTVKANIIKISYGAENAHHVIMLLFRNLP